MTKPPPNSSFIKIPKGKEETALQIECKSWFDDNYRLIKKAFFKIHNEGKKSKRQGSEDKAAGIVSGVADSLLSVAKCGYNGFYIEFKKPGEKQSPAQKIWESEIKPLRYKYMVIDNKETFMDEVKAYLGDFGKL
jgi:hypothetical protein